MSPRSEVRLRPPPTTRLRREKPPAASAARPTVARRSDVPAASEHAVVAAPLFTRAGYARILADGLDGGYSFRAFDDPFDPAGRPVCLLRHDVDADPGAALELAHIEAGLGVRSTYFLMLRSAVYNPLGRANSAIVREILSLGHWLGLHLDISFMPGDERDALEWAALERRMLEQSFDTEVGAVSFHQPGQSPRPLPSAFDGMVLASSEHDLPGFFYLSDSNKAERTHRAAEILRNATEPRFQFLVHPIWWVSDDPDASTEHLWTQAIVRNLERSQEQLLACEGAFGTPRRFIIAPR